MDRKLVIMYNQKIKKFTEQGRKREYWRNAECLLCDKPARTIYRIISISRFSVGRPYCSFGHYYLVERMRGWIFLMAVTLVTTIMIFEDEVARWFMGKELMIILSIVFLPFIFIGVILIVAREDKRWEL